MSSSRVSTMVLGVHTRGTSTGPDGDGHFASDDLWALRCTRYIHSSKSDKPRVRSHPVDRANIIVLSGLGPNDEEPS